MNKVEKVWEEMRRDAAEYLRDMIVREGINRQTNIENYALLCYRFQCRAEEAEAELVKLRDAMTKIHIAADTTRIFFELHGDELDRDDCIGQLSSLVTTILDTTMALEESEE